MKLWQKFKRLMPNRKKKKRVKKTEAFPSPTLTTAETLIMNNWNITFANPEPARAGETRAAERLRKKQKANRDIPTIERPPSRQVRRAAERRDFKALRAMAREERRRNNQIAKGLIPT
jgi:hypothetical protein